jgi:sugar phosphate isomerase/epimerase
MSYSLSTKWNINKHSDPAKVIHEILKLGITCMEVSCNTPEKFIPAYKKLVHEGTIEVSSLHNYCPAPTDRKPDGDSYLLSSVDESLRREAVEKTKRTMYYASELGAKAVVIHLGRVEIDEVTAPIKRCYDSGCLTDHALHTDIEHSKAARISSERLYFDSVLRSLDELIPTAQKLHLIMGLENRLRHRQIPLPHEITEIFNRLDGAPVGYWHDLGHAAFLEKLGFVQPGELLEAGGPWLVGLHLHDMRGLDDHRAPGKGTVDFRRLLPYLTKRPNAIRVLEISSSQTVDEVRRGIEYLKKLGI